MRLGPWERKIIASLIKGRRKAKWGDIKKEHSGHSKLSKRRMSPDEYIRVNKIHRSLYSALITLESLRKLEKGYVAATRHNRRITALTLTHLGIRELHERKIITDEDLKTLE